jgi:DNA-binding NtrC family response regulator
MVAHIRLQTSQAGGAGQSENVNLSGLRILVVEDNFLIASLLKRMLTNWGCQVIGPVPTLNEGKRLAETESLSGAILDINIVGGNSVPIAAALQDRGCPFIFITGYGSPKTLPAPLREVTRLDKPIDEFVLQATLAHEIAGKQSSARR